MGSPGALPPCRQRITHYLTDEIGSVRVATDAFGRESEEWRYDAFGVAYEEDFGDAHRYGYAGKPYDEETDAYDYGFRDYAAPLGRFQTVDPIRDGTNWYAYCGNDPVNYTDPDGLQMTADTYITGSMWSQSNVPTQAQFKESVKALEEFIAPITEHVSMSITLRGVSRGASATLTGSSGQTDVGGGLSTGEAVSLTIDLNVSIPVSTPLPLSTTMGASFTPPNWPSGTTAGFDVTWNDTALVFSMSAGIGLGKREFHVLFSDNLPGVKNK